MHPVQRLSDHPPVQMIPRRNESAPKYRKYLVFFTNSARLTTVLGMGWIDVFFEAANKQNLL